ncbi:MAG: hypothetical protein HY203_09060 [Nitrospirae bacterium]|nr:hypothetical protein [Nitrospirota bacterium]
MRKTWRLRGGSDTLIVVRRSDLSNDEKTTVDHSFLAANLDRWLADPLSRRDLLDMCGSLGGSATIRSNLISVRDLHRYVKPHLEKAFQRGDLVALRTPRAIGDIGAPTVAVATPAAKRPSVAPQAKEKTSWVEIELVDEEGNPVSEEKYRIELPNGSIREGFLDSSGYVLLGGIDPGLCKVSFPNLDAETWERA